MATDSWVRSDLRLGRRWLLIGGLAIVAVLSVSVIPMHSEPTGVTYIDKFAHFFVFVGLMLFFNGFLQPRLRPYLALMLAACGVLIELLQIPVPGRAAELADFAANVLGIGVGWLLIQLNVFNWCHWLEARLPRHG